MLVHRRQGDVSGGSSLLPVSSSSKVGRPVWKKNAKFELARMRLAERDKIGEGWKDGSERKHSGGLGTCLFIIVVWLFFSFFLSNILITLFESTAISMSFSTISLPFRERKKGFREAYAWEEERE